MAMMKQLQWRIIKIIKDVSNSFYFDCRPQISKASEDSTLSLFNWRHPLLFSLFSTAIVSSLPSPSDDEEKANNNPDVDFHTNCTDVLPPHTLR